MAIFFNFSPTLNHLHPLQVKNCDSNSRLVVDEDNNSKFRLERVEPMFYTFMDVTDKINQHDSQIYLHHPHPPSPSLFRNHKTGGLCWFNARPTSTALNQHSLRVLCLLLDASKLHVKDLAKTRIYRPVYVADSPRINWTTRGFPWRHSVKEPLC